MSSEYGRGCTYCLALFIEHQNRVMDYKKSEEMHKLYYSNAYLWFDGAGDHIKELEIPNNLNKELTNRIKIFKDKVLNWRYEGAFDCDWDDVEWALREAKDLLIEIDKQVLKLNACEGDWE